MANLRVALLLLVGLSCVAGLLPGAAPARGAAAGHMDVVAVLLDAGERDGLAAELAATTDGATSSGGCCESAAGAVPAPSPWPLDAVPAIGSVATASAQRGLQMVGSHPCDWCSCKLWILLAHGLLSHATGASGFTTQCLAARARVLALAARVQGAAAGVRRAGPVQAGAGPAERRVQWRGGPGRLRAALRAADPARQVRRRGAAASARTKLTSGGF